ncbi:MAG: hypothetical protein P4L53_06935 [Candidatus Obscuribacterales bacterium]|nr:hypothetical protein [Candidatus Obscuribacterales bacterium]
MASNLLCFTGLFLGIRHGFDLDHMTAISDLVSAKAAASINSAASIDQPSAKFQSYILAGMYAFGHALVVAVLGLGALLFRATLPDWIDPIMQRLVGLSLLLFGLWILYCMRAMRTTRSRGLMVLQAISKTKHVLFQRFLKQELAPHAHDPSDFCNARCALAIGALHGIGAETGTQVILMTSMGSANSVPSSLFMLGSFVSGMLIANVGLAVFISEGYFRAMLSQRLIATFNLSIAFLNIVIGAIFVSGKADIFGL